MSNYSLTILIKNDLDEKKRKEILDGIKAKVESEGKILKEDLWGSKNLAYPIQHRDKAYFVLYEFESEPSKILSLDKMVKLNEDIIRYLLLRKE